VRSAARGIAAGLTGRNKKGRAATRPRKADTTVSTTSVPQHASAPKPVVEEVLALQHAPAFEPPMPQAPNAFQEELEEYCSMLREHLDEAEQLFGIAEDEPLYPPEGPDRAFRSRLLIIAALAVSAIERMDDMQAEGGAR
jgi:hypothetical protein